MAHDRTTVQGILDKALAEGRTSLSAPEAKQVADAYGIPTPGEALATSADEAAKLSAEIGFPVVLKIVSPDILHKTDAGGVVVGVKSDDDARSAYDEILANAKAYQADADITGVQVQKMLETGPGRAGGHRRVGDRPGVRQDRRVRPRRRAGRGAQGRHVPARTDHARGSAVDGGRDRRGRGAERRAWRQAGRQGRTGRDHLGAVRPGHRLPAVLRGRPEPGARRARRRDRRRRPDHRRSRGRQGAPCGSRRRRSSRR